MDIAVSYPERRENELNNKSAMANERTPAGHGSGVEF